MRVAKLALSCLTLVLALTAVLGTARANEWTPFIENSKLGDVKTARARLIHIGDDVYVVVVMSDTAKYFPIPAKAKAGVVKPEQCKDGMTVEAKITSYTKRPNNYPAVELEILSVK